MSQKNKYNPPLPEKYFSQAEHYHDTLRELNLKEWECACKKIIVDFEIQRFYTNEIT